MTGNTSDILSANISNNASLLVLTEGITDTFYISLFFIQIPGITTNLVSLYMIISESRHTKLPTNFLLLMLCLTDFTAVCTTCLWHTMSRFGTVDTYNICAIKVYTQTFCPTFSGVVSVFMAIDRALAFCMPFFYRIHITKKTWSFVCLGGFLFISSLCILPHAGLGSMWNPRYKNNTVSYRCSAFQFPDEPKKKTFLILYLTIAFTLICAIILCNTFVMVAILKLRKRSVDAKKSAGSGTTFKSATEIRFAVIVGVLACVFVICWGPYYVSVLYTLFDVYMSRSVKGNIHRLAGISFTADPFVYLIIRKSNRQVLRRIFCFFRCSCKEELVDLSSASVNTLQSTKNTQETVQGNSTTDM